MVLLEDGLVVDPNRVSGGIAPFPAMADPEPGGAQVTAAPSGPATEEDQGMELGIERHTGIGSRRWGLSRVLRQPGCAVEDPGVTERAEVPLPSEHHHLFGVW